MPLDYGGLEMHETQLGQERLFIILERDEKLQLPQCCDEPKDMSC